MIDVLLWKSILGFIEEYKEINETSGILICGSLIKGQLRPGSDIDILILQNKVDFEMEVIQKEAYPIDRLHAKSELLESILKERTELSDILSLSFGSAKIIIEDSPSLRSIMEIAEQNIIKRNLSYSAPLVKEPHIVDGAVFTVGRMDSRFWLLKDGITVI